jgi:GxxExxY protein
MRPEIYKDEGYKLMGAAFEVFNDRGFGMAEEIYQECMEIELELRGHIGVETHHDLRVHLLLGLISVD